jgi:hypothetical protein
MRAGLFWLNDGQWSSIVHARVAKRGVVVPQGRAKLRLRVTDLLRALSDPDCKPCVFYLTPGQDADIAAAPALLAL